MSVGFILMYTDVWLQDTAYTDGYRHFREHRQIQCHHVHNQYEMP